MLPVFGGVLPAGGDFGQKNDFQVGNVLQRHHIYDRIVVII